MGKNSNNKLLIVKMIEIYKPVDFDWMSYKITRNNPLTFHHTEEMMGEAKILKKFSQNLIYSKNV